MKKTLVILLVVLMSSASLASGTTTRRAKKAPKRRAPTRVFKPQPRPTISPERRALHESVSFYISAKSSDNVFQIADPLAQAQWSLKPLRTAPVVTEIAKGRYRVTRDFEGTLGADPTTHKVALDFYTKGMGTRWSVNRVKIKSVNGNER